ncbi:MAG: sigma-70 family RNA polymerase sigma factor [Elusimicrobiota bacterium]|nr:sigma-70 family RNA polymerase sigma factor [Elusimicrobiota bacterium]
MDRMDGDELIRRYGRIVYNLALRLTGNPAEAADLAQDSLVKALKGLPSFRGGNAGVWTYRITVNAWKNFLRAKDSRRTDRFFSADGDGVESEPQDAASPEPGPEAFAAAGDEKARIEKALTVLTPEERAVLVLRELDGLSYAEVAEALDLPLGTVKSRLVRARTVLADALAEENTDAA